MKITTTTTTIDLPDDHPVAQALTANQGDYSISPAVAHAARLERETGLSVDGEPLEDIHVCDQCGGLLEADRISPTGERALDESMCEDCELEYTNPAAWYRKHPETPRYTVVKADEAGAWHIVDHANGDRPLPRKGPGKQPPARLSEERARAAAARLCNERQRPADRSLSKR